MRHNDFDQARESPGNDQAAKPSRKRDQEQPWPDRIHEGIRSSVECRSQTHTHRPGTRCRSPARHPHRICAPQPTSDGRARATRPRPQAASQRSSQYVPRHVSRPSRPHPSTLECRHCRLRRLRNHHDIVKDFHHELLENSRVSLAWTKRGSLPANLIA